MGIRQLMTIKIRLSVINPNKLLSKSATELQKERKLQKLLKNVQKYLDTLHKRTLVKLPTYIHQLWCTDDTIFSHNPVIYVRMSMAVINLDELPSLTRFGDKNYNIEIERVQNPRSVVRGLGANWKIYVFDDIRIKWVYTTNRHYFSEIPTNAKKYAESPEEYTRYYHRLQRFLNKNRDKKLLRANITNDSMNNSIDSSVSSLSSSSSVPDPSNFMIDIKNELDPDLVDDCATKKFSQIRTKYKKLKLDNVLLFQSDLKDMTATHSTAASCNLNTDSYSNSPFIKNTLPNTPINEKKESYESYQNLTQSAKTCFQPIVTKPEFAFPALNFTQWILNNQLPSLVNYIYDPTNIMSMQSQFHNISPDSLLGIKQQPILTTPSLLRSLSASAKASASASASVSTSSSSLKTKVGNDYTQNIFSYENVMNMFKNINGNTKTEEKNIAQPEKTIESDEEILNKLTNRYDIIKKQLESIQQNISANQRKLDFVKEKDKKLFEMVMKMTDYDINEQATYLHRNSQYAESIKKLKVIYDHLVEEESSLRTQVDQMELIIIDLRNELESQHKQENLLTEELDKLNQKQRHLLREIGYVSNNIAVLGDTSKYP